MQAQAHVVPNMTIEAEFAKDRRYTLRINLDPRVFLSEQPTSLPPVPAEWYLKQAAAEKEATHAQAMAYLRETLGLTFGDQKTSLPECDFVALDGATLEALAPETAETHLLATAHGEIPEHSRNYTLAFGRQANVSLILLNSMAGGEKQPQVLFPGETSRPFTLPEPEAQEEGPLPALSLEQVSVTQHYPGAGKVMVGIGLTVMLLFAAGAWLIRRSKRG